MTLERRKLLIRTLPKASWSCSVWPDWAIYWTLGNFWSLWQQLICPNLPHSYGIFVRVSKSFIVLVKSFMANFYRHLAFFSGHNDHVLLSFFPSGDDAKTCCTRGIVSLDLWPHIRFTLVMGLSLHSCVGVCVCVWLMLIEGLTYTRSLSCLSPVWPDLEFFLPLWQKFTSLCQIFYG